MIYESIPPLLLRHLTNSPHMVHMYLTSDSLYPFNHSRWSFVQLDSNEIVATEKTHLYRKKSKKLKNKKQITKVLKKCPEESLLYYFYKIVSIISRLCRQRTDFKLFTQIKNKYCCKKLWQHHVSSNPKYFLEKILMFKTTMVKILD